MAKDYKRLMNIIDLHTHTIFSDGGATPDEFVAQLYKEKQQLAADGLNLRAFALTDHDSMNAIEPMKRALAEYEKRKDITNKLLFLQGMEISTHADGLEIHVLGYFPNISLSEIDKQIGKEVQVNMEAANKCYQFEQMKPLLNLIEKRITELTGKPYCNKDLGKLLIRLQEIYEQYKKDKFSSKLSTDKIQWVLPFPRELIRMTLTETGIAPKSVLAKYTSRSDPKKELEGFYLELNKKSRNPLPEEKVNEMAKEDIGKHTYMPRLTESYTPTEKAVKLISSVGGKAFFAHPYEFINRKGKNAFKTFVCEKLVPAGLKGIECYYPEHNKDMISYLIDFAKLNKLMISGGTDDHMKRDYDRFGVGHSNLRIPFELYEKIVS